MYTVTNYQSGKQVKEAFIKGETIRVYQPNEIFPHNPNGEVTIEGPHYPKPHKWYLRVTIENNIIVKIHK